MDITADKQHEFLMQKRKVLLRMNCVKIVNNEFWKYGGINYGINDRYIQCHECGIRLIHSRHEYDSIIVWGLDSFSTEHECYRLYKVLNNDNFERFIKQDNQRIIFCKQCNTEIGFQLDYPMAKEYYLNHIVEILSFTNIENDWHNSQADWSE